MHAVNQCETLELNSNKECEPMKMVIEADMFEVRGSRASSLAAAFRTD